MAEEVFDEAYKILFQKASNFYVKNEAELICDFWRMLEKKGCPLPSDGLSENFVRRCLQIIHDGNKKIGDMHTYKNFGESFADALNEMYGMEIFRK